MNIDDKISAMYALYQEVDDLISQFQRQTHIDCVVGCGACCSRVAPYITVIEGLIIVKSRKIQFVDSHSNAVCPFYSNSRTLHCSIYEVRPLICRLFAFSARIENGQLCYFPCKMIQKCYSYQVADVERRMNKDFPIPIYKKIQQKLQAIDFILATDLHPVRRSVEIATQYQQQIATGEYQEQQIAMRNSKNFASPFSNTIREYLCKRSNAPPNQLFISSLQKNIAFPELFR